jgi:hypothetical protein
MYVSHDRRSDVTAATCPGSVVVGGWLLTMAAVAAFAFTTGDALLDNEDPVLVSQSVASFDPSLSATGSALAIHQTSTHVIENGVHSTSTTAPIPGTKTAVAPGGTCHARLATPATGSVQRVSTRELASRSTHTRSGASLSRISATACRVGSAAKLNTAGVSSPALSAGAARPAQAGPAVN